MIDLSTLYHQMSMYVGEYILAHPELSDDDRQSLIDYQNKLQDLASDFIDCDVEETLDNAETSLAAINSAVNNAKTTATKIAQVSKVLQVAAATASLGFAVFTGVTTGNYGAITGALSDLVKVATAKAV